MRAINYLFFIIGTNISALTIENATGQYLNEVKIISGNQVAATINNITPNQTKCIYLRTSVKNPIIEVTDDYHQKGITTLPSNIIENNGHIKLYDLNGITYASSGINNLQANYEVQT